MRFGGDRVTKVFLDSRYALADGSLEIPSGGLLLEPSDRCWLGEVSCVSSWDTVASTSNLLYVEERLFATSISRRTVAIPNGGFDVETLATAMALALNGAGKAAGFGTYAVTRTVGTSGSMSRTYTVTCGGSLSKIPDEWYVGYFYFQNKARL